MKIILIILFLILIVISGCEDNQDVRSCKKMSLFAITEQTEKPIFETNSNWNYASVVDPTIVEFEGKYYMWYTGRGNSNFQVGFAISHDGENWFEYTKNPVLKAGGRNDFDEHHIRRPYVILDDGIFKMWYSGYGSTDSGEPHYSIGYAESFDGISWVKHSTKPVLDVSLGEWDDIDILLGSVVKRRNIYHLWYNGLSSKYLENTDSNNSNNIADGGYATSINGINWTKHKSPVFLNSQRGFESITIDVRGVNWIEDGDFYEMLYSGKELGENSVFYRSIGRAYSDNGIDWVKDINNPIITFGDVGIWNQYSAAAGVFIRKGNDYKIWFSGVGGSNIWNIGFLTAEGICE